MSDLTFKELRNANAQRLLSWHSINSWSISDWAVAMAGEAGEVCNAVKKLNRIRDGISNISTHSRQVDTTTEAINEIGEEIADTIIYLDLLAQRLGLDMAGEVARKFNVTSDKYGFTTKLCV